MRRSREVLLGLLILGGAKAAYAGEPWWDRASCIEAVEKVHEADLEGAERAISALEKSKDPDDLACTVYARVNLSEQYLSVFGMTKRWKSNRQNQLKRMAGFANAYAKHGLRFKDLEMEARLRRIRALFEDGNKTEAIKEASRTDGMLDRRINGPSNPTVQFVTGLLYTTLGSAPFYQRALLQMAGIGGDAELGHKQIKRLANGSTAYKIEANYVSHHFAWERSKEGEVSAFGKATQTGAELVRLVPENPQFVVEYARALRTEGRCEESLPFFEPIVQRIEREPGAWSADMRSKVLYSAGRCALKVDRLEQAARFSKLLDVQDEPKWADKVTWLRREVAQREAATPAARTSGGGEEG